MSIYVLYRSFIFEVTSLGLGYMRVHGTEQSHNSHTTTAKSTLT